MINKILNIEDVLNKYEYYELPNHKMEGSFIIIEKKFNLINVKIDRFSTIPFYYYVFKGKFFGSTSLQDLINKKPKEFRITLNKEASLFFLKTNTLINDYTFINEINRLPYGCELSFNVKNSETKITRYWKFSPNKNTLNFNENLEMIYHSYENTMFKYLSKKKRIAANISGGYDTRQILGFLVNNKIKFTGYTYGVKENPDQKIALELSKKYKFSLFFKEWKDIKFYEKNFDKNFDDTDGMLAFHHFHPLNIIENQERNEEEIVFYGHFLDFFLQAWNYQGILENNKNSINFIKESFGNVGNFSVISNNDFSNLINTRYKNLFNEILDQEISNLNYLPPDKIYEALYFIHHGTRRLLPQVQAASKYVDYALPGLNSIFFDNVWSIPGKIKKNNSIKEALIKKYYKKVCDVSILFNNYKVDYVGPIPFINHFYKFLRILKSTKVGLSKPYYDFWGKEIYNLIDRDLNNWIKKEINSSPIFDYDFLDKDNYLKFLSSPDVKLSTLGTFITLSKFIKRNF